ncbi:putative membrane protein [Okibacterium sp. HSC-33S16]|uniref:SdpI family protein n=1 Tax=Okibacterium sp. HSC-33S16 TaxID=2910965 RepID=UPI0020A058CE|nr:SdpI family protein [Okibacterium sp. HSC-33S16]MCP2031125.1 putative membrane protein [Okibacterium sp. HSC-33S16]
MDEELVGRVVMALILIAGGTVVLAVARATASARIGRNPIAGIRIPATMASDEAWLVAHRAAERHTTLGAWCAFASVIPAILPVPFGVAVVSILVGSIAMMVLVLIGAAVGARAARGLSSEN